MAYGLMAGSTSAARGLRTWGIDTGAMVLNRYQDLSGFRPQKKKWRFCEKRAKSALALKQKRIIPHLVFGNSVATVG